MPTGQTGRDRTQGGGGAIMLAVMHVASRLGEWRGAASCIQGASPPIGQDCMQRWRSAFGAACVRVRSPDAVHDRHSPAAACLSLAQHTITSSPNHIGRHWQPALLVLLVAVVAFGGGWACREGVGWPVASRCSCCCGGPGPGADALSAALLSLLPLLPLPSSCRTTVKGTGIGTPAGRPPRAEGREGS